MVLAILVVTARKWSGPNLVLTILVVLAVLAALPLALVRIGLNLAVSNYDALGAISVAGTAIALIAGAVFLLVRRYQERPTVLPAAGEPSVTPIPDLAAEPETDAADELDSATATLMAQPDVTPLADEPVQRSITHGVGPFQLRLHGRPDHTSGPVPAHPWVEEKITTSCWTTLP